MKITCIIVEDESIARKALAEYVGEVGVLELKGTFRNALEANEFLQNNDIDLIFLDIEMPQINGLQFLRLLKKKAGVIFTTAYSRFALESFEFDVIDYLLKPISFERFLQAINKSTRFLGVQSAGGQENYLYVKEGSTIKRVLISDIEYVEAMQNYIRIHTAHEFILTLMTLKDFLAQLPEDRFTQTHRSYVVNLQKVKKIQGEVAYVTKGEVPISKRLRSEVIDRFNVESK